jgi:hypothetical protein
LQEIIVGGILDEKNLFCAVFCLVFDRFEFCPNE